jgi:prepilin-type N-terminal cleavage/methylation domain-containing protein
MDIEQQPRTARYGVTLVELLVVLAIAVILLGMLFPAIHYSREAARRATCAGNLQQLAIAYRQFIELRAPRERPEGTVGGWAIDVLPFIEEQVLADGLSGYPILDPKSPLPLVLKRPVIMSCPSGYEGDSSIATVPPSHYSNDGRIGDVRVSSRVPWVFSPQTRLGGPAALMPHSGGYNAINVYGNDRDGVRFVSED